jgi:hypothetical protein
MGAAEDPAGQKTFGSNVVGEVEGAPDLGLGLAGRYPPTKGGTVTVRWYFPFRLHFLS